MKRIVKDPDERRLEIIQAAEKLFNEKGYGKTTVEDIIRYVGVAKGTFYYYFKSKEEILHALVEHIGMKMEAHFSDIASRKDISALQKLSLMLRGPEKNKIVQKKKKVIKLAKTENREMQEQLNIFTINRIIPQLHKVFEQGFHEKIFKKPISLETLELFFAGSQFVLESDLFEITKDKRKLYLQTMQDILENILGAKPGLLDFISDESSLKE